MIYLFDESKTLTGMVRDEHVRSLLYDREKNGMYDISAEIPVIAYHQGTRYNLHTKTKDAVFLGHYDLEGRFQLHKIAGYDVNSDTIAILGVHLFFDEAKAGAIIKDRRYIDKEVRDGARDAFNTIGWQMADFDVSPTRTYNFYNVSPLEARTILIETFGFEFDYWIDFDGKKINGKYFSVKKQIGQDSGKRYTYDKHTNTGHHVLDLTAETDYSEVFTAVIGRGKGEEIEETGGYGRRIEYTDIEWSKPNRPLDKPLGSRVLIDPEATQAFGYVLEDGTVTPRTAVVEFSDIEEQSELIEASYDWLVEHRQPKLVFDVNVADGDGLELGDTVYIKYNEIGLNMAVRVGKVIDDLKSGERQVQLGDVAYFKPGRSNRDIKRSIRQERIDATNRIYQLKLEFDERFENEVQQIHEDYEQALIDTRAEIEAAEQRYEDKWEQYEAEIDETIERIVGGSIEALDTNLLDVNNRLLSKLEESDLQPFQGRIDEAFSDISEVSGDLNTARTELQKQLVDVDSSIDTANDKIEAAEVRITNAEGKLVTNDQSIADAQERLTQAEQDISEHGTDIGTVQQTLTNINGELANKVERTEYNALEGTVTSHGTRISQNETDISSKAEQTEVDTISGTVSDHSTQISQNATDIKSKADSTTVDSIDETVTSHSTLISQNATDIQSKADASVVDSLAGTVESHSTEISQNAEAITSKADASVVDTLQNTVSTHSTEISQNATAITTKADKSVVDTLSGTVGEHSTTISQTAEELTRKADSSVVDAINDTVENHTLTITETAEDVSSLIEKTELHDGDIAQWSNETKANAEEIGRTLTRISDIDGEIETAQTNISTNADGISGLLTRTSSAERSIADINLSVDGYRAEVVTLQGDIDDANSWMSEKGSIIDGNADAIRTRVWQNDIDAIEVGGRNWIKNSNDFSHYGGYSGSSVIKEYGIEVEEWGSTDATRLTVTGGTTALKFTPQVTGDFSKEFTYSVWMKNEGENEIVLNYNGFGNRKSEYPLVLQPNESRRMVITGNMRSSHNWMQTQYRNEYDTPMILVLWREQLEKGNKATDWTPAPEDTEQKITQLNTEINVEAGRINALLTRTSSAEKSIADINTSVDGITADFANYKKDIDSDVGALSSQVASYEASVSGFRAEVGTLQGDIDGVDSWISEKGSIIDGNADAISARVWQKDIDAVEVGGRNLLVNSTTFNSPWDSATTGLSDALGGSEGAKSDNNLFGYNVSGANMDKFTPGIYTFSMWVKADTAFTCRFGYRDGGASSLPSYNVTTEWTKVSYTFTTSEITTSGRVIYWYPSGNMMYFSHPKLEKGNKATDWTPAPEDTLMKTDFILESDGFFLGGKYVGGDHYSTAIVGSKDGIDILADRMRVTGDLLVKGDVESYALSAVRGDIADLRSRILTSNVVNSDHLNVNAALANKFNANSAFISRLEVQAANIRDLTGTHIRGGLLDSLNGATRLNLNTGDWTIGGSAKIIFTNRNNRIEYSNRGITGGIQFDHSLGSDGRPMTAVGVSDGAFDVNDSTFRGLIVHSLGTEGLLGYGSSIITQDGGFYTRTDRTGSGFTFRLHATGGNPRGIFPQNSGSYDYHLGSVLNPWLRAHIRDIRTTGELWIRDWNSSGGWKVNTMADSGSSLIILRGVNTGSWNYNLGSTTYRMNAIYLRNSPNVSSDERLKEDIKPSDLGLDFINGIEIKSFRKIAKEADIKDGRLKNHVEYGLIAQQLRDNLISHNVDVDDIEMLSIGDDGYYGVQHEQLIAPTIKAVQDLNVKVESNTEKIARLEKEIETLKGA